MGISMASVSMERGLLQTMPSSLMIFVRWEASVFLALLTGEVLVVREL